MCPSCAIGGAQSLKSLSDNRSIDFELEQSAYDVRVEKASASSPAERCLSLRAVEHRFLSMAEIIIFPLVVSKCLPSSLMF